MRRSRITDNRGKVVSKSGGGGRHQRHRCLRLQRQPSSGHHRRHGDQQQSLDRDQQTRVGRRVWRRDVHEGAGCPTPQCDSRQPSRHLLRLLMTAGMRGSTPLHWLSRFSARGPQKAVETADSTFVFVLVGRNGGLYKDPPTPPPLPDGCMSRSDHTAPNLASVLEGSHGGGHDHEQS